MARPVTRNKTKAMRDGIEPGSLDDLARELWYAILTASELLEDDDKAIRLKAVHAVQQAAGQYRSLWETMELSGRVAALEIELGLAKSRGAAAR